MDTQPNLNPIQAQVQIQPKIGQEGRGDKTRGGQVLTAIRKQAKV